MGAWVGADVDDGARRLIGWWTRIWCNSAISSASSKGWLTVFGDIRYSEAVARRSFKLHPHLVDRDFPAEAQAPKLPTSLPQKVLRHCDNETTTTRATSQPTSMPIGPSLPPHLAKRTRDDDDERSASPDSGDKRRRVMGPAPPPAAIGPSMPPQSRSRSSSVDSDVGPAPPPASKPARILGPAPPPAPLDERPPNPPSDDSDSSDDDFGPAPPPAGGSSYTYDDEDASRPAASAFDTDPQYSEQNKKVQRDSWMTMPPTQDDLAARMDPSKQRARKFNTGKSAGGGGGGMSAVWTETPEQKLKRLQDEAMGIAAHSNSDPSKKESRRNKAEEKNARRLKEQIDASRGKSLVEQHQDKGGKEQEDDPSKRVFDYEKDMALGTKVSHKQKREMLNKAKGFGDRFASGSYL